MTSMLGWLAGDALAESIAGDLKEERRRRGRWWFFRSSLAVIIFFLAGRLRDLARDLARDLRFGGGREWRQSIQSLRRTPWYSLTVIGVIGLTMTLATTVFAIVDGVLFKPLPYQIASSTPWVCDRSTDGCRVRRTSRAMRTSPC